MPSGQFQNVEGVRHQSKYLSKNPISRYLVSGFFRTFRDLIKDLKVQKVLEVGSAEGYLSEELRKLFPAAQLSAFDIETNNFDPHKMKDISLLGASAKAIPFRDETFDLSICCEVLEHIEDPGPALKDISRITNNWALFSVPLEPLWRILNMSRGAYIREWGNTPDHVNHWGGPAFQSFLKPHFEIITYRRSLPWQFALCRKRNS